MLNLRQRRRPRKPAPALHPSARKARPMNEPRLNAQAHPAPSAEAPARGRMPFVAPTVEDLGRLKDLTLVGGSL